MATDTRGGGPQAAAEAAPPVGETPRHQATASGVTLTGRGGVVVVFAATLLGAMIGGLFGLHGAQGLFFDVGCVLAVLTIRRTDLLTLVVSPPLIFFLVSVLSAVTGSLGEKSFLVSVLLTVVTTLTASMPWLFVGAVLVVVIAVPRGLPAALRELSVRVAADHPFRSRTSLLGRKNADDDPVRWDETPKSGGKHAAPDDGDTGSHRLGAPRQPEDPPEPEAP